MLSRSCSARVPVTMSEAPGKSDVVEENQTLDWQNKQRLRFHGQSRVPVPGSRDGSRAAAARPPANKTIRPRRGFQRA